MNKDSGSPEVDDRLTELARTLREELGDSLHEGTPTSDLK